jgi:copper chaperone CopZ
MPNILEVSFVLEGMTCNGCVASVKRVLDRLPGVEALEVQIGRATVRMDPDLVSEQALRDTLTRAGYTATRAE